MNEREIWLSPQKNVVGLFEAVKYLKNRELMFLKGIRVRWIHAASFNFLQKVFKTFDVNKKNCCAYASLDHYKNIPIFTSNLQKRKSETDSWINDGGKKITGVDFGIDIDYKETDWKSAEDDLYKLLQFYETSKVKYAIWKTTHGFHIIIPFEEVVKFMPSASMTEYRDFYYLIAKKLMKVIPTIDLSAYMETRVFRCPYLLDHENEVILPLKYSELGLLFRGKIITTPSWVLKNVRLKNRGVFINGESGNFENFIDGVDKI